MTAREANKQQPDSEVATNNCQHQHCGAIDELHAEPGTSEILTPA
ncbi:hypothetical protein [Caballeronia udeis]|nr:hypothetical protein [Caballeronia udeis]